MLELHKYEYFEDGMEPVTTANLAPRRVLENKHFTEVKYREIILWAYCILVELVGGTARGATDNKGQPIRIPRPHTSLTRTDGRTDGLWTKVPANDASRRNDWLKY